MKRTLALLMTAVLLAVCLFGCGKTADNSAETTENAVSAEGHSRVLFTMENGDSSSTPNMLRKPLKTS